MLPLHLKSYRGERVQLQIYADVRNTECKCLLKLGWLRQQISRNVRGSLLWAQISGSCPLFRQKEGPKLSFKHLPPPLVKKK